MSSEEDGITVYTDPLNEDQIKAALLYVPVDANNNICPITESTNLLAYQLGYEQEVESLGFGEIDTYVKVLTHGVLFDRASGAYNTLFSAIENITCGRVAWLTENARRTPWEDSIINREEL